MDKHEKNSDISDRKTSILEIDSELDKQLHQGFFLHEVLVKPDLGIVIRETERFHLAPKAMEVLVLLASQPDSVVTYEQILGVVWANSNASKSTVSHTISEIRQVLGDPKECPIMIQTIPRKGYRLKVTPTLLENSDADNLGLPSPGPLKLSWAMIKSSRLFKVSAAYILFSWIMLQAFAIIFPIFEFPDWGLKLATLGLIIGFIIVIIYYWFSEIDARKRLAKAKATKVTLIKQFIFDSIFVFGALGVIFLISTHLVEKIDEQVSNPGTTTFGSAGVNSNAVAVFPFSYSQHSDETSYYPATIQEELISYLSSSHQIKVTSLRSTNSMPQNSDINAIKQQLKARYLIEGTISYDQETLEITSRLIDTETGFQLWQDKLSGNKNQLLALNEELFRKVQNALLLLITGSSKENESVNRPTENFAAYDAYLQGKAAYIANKGLTSLKQAEQHFTNALALDNQFVLAASALCKTNLSIYELSQTTSEYRKAKDSCELTASYDQVSGESHLALGKMYLTNGQYLQAERQLKAALEVDEHNSEAMIELAQSYLLQERPEQARRYLERAIKAEPGYWSNYFEYGVYLFNIGEYEAAIPQFKKVNLLTSGMAKAYVALGGCYMLLWRLPDAVSALTKAIEFAPTSGAYSNLATTHFWQGKFDLAVNNYQKALELNPDNVTLWGNLADAIRYSQASEIDAQNAYQRALQLAKQVEQINPHDINLKAQISRYHSELQQCDQASNYLASVAHSEHQDPQVFYDMAIVAKNCLSNVQMKNMLSKSVSLGMDERVILADPQFLDYKEELIRLFHNDAGPTAGD